MEQKQPIEVDITEKDILSDPNLQMHFIYFNLLEHGLNWNTQKNKNSQESKQSQEFQVICDDDEEDKVEVNGTNGVGQNVIGDLSNQNNANSETKQQGKNQVEIQKKNDEKQRTASHENNEIKKQINSSRESQNLDDLNQVKKKVQLHYKTLVQQPIDRKTKKQTKHMLEKLTQKHIELMKKPFLQLNNNDPDLLQYKQKIDNVAVQLQLQSQQLEYVTLYEKSLYMKKLEERKSEKRPEMVQQQMGKQDDLVKNNTENILKSNGILIDQFIQQNQQAQLIIKEYFEDDEKQINLFKIWVKKNQPCEYEQYRYLWNIPKNASLLFQNDIYTNSNGNGKMNNNNSNDEYLYQKLYTRLSIEFLNKHAVAYIWNTNENNVLKMLKLKFINRFLEAIENPMEFNSLIQQTESVKK